MTIDIDDKNFDINGLSPELAAKQLKEDGPNEQAASHRRNWVDRIWDMSHEPMFVLLIAAAAIYLVLGDLSEGLTLGIFVLAVLGLTLYQEGKSDRSIESLRALSQHTAQVIRAGVIIKLPSVEIVKGDLLIISEGDRISADGFLVKADNVTVDESLLTGESVPVEKQLRNNQQERTFVFSGTYVIRGQGLVQVTATGPRTEIGKIGASLNQLGDEETPLHRQTAKLVKILSSLGLVLCTAMVLTLGFRTGEWLPAILSGIALAMAMLPEEYPVVLAIFPALGAHRLAKQGVLTRRINAIETLGATTVLCTDKTGTLTQNQMTVQALMVPDEVDKWALFKVPSRIEPSEFSAQFHELVEHAILASAANPFDPMEMAFHQFGQSWLGGTEHLHADWTLVQTYPLSSELRAMSHIWQVANTAKHVISAKGAPEAIIRLCHMTPQQQTHWETAIGHMAETGLRVLAVAEGHHSGTAWPTTSHEIDFKFLGLIGLSDPIRDEVPAAMSECHQAGIRVVMITGDYPKTARVIASQAGMPSGDLLTGDEVESLNDTELRQRMQQVNVCARISPHQKLRIVQALQHNGDIVTMTGDGVNDAPALRAAHVGVAMGARGTDVAREAADLILVNDDFASIVRGIRTGRRIFTNLQRSMAYIFAIHIPIAGLAIIPMLFALPPLFLPLHIALLEMIIDPACSLAFESEPESPDCMTSPPRDTTAPLFGLPAMLEAFGLGLWVLASALCAYWASQYIQGSGDAVHQTRSMVILAFVTANGFLIFMAKSRHHLAWQHNRPWNKTALLIAGGTLCLVLAAQYTPVLAHYLSFSPLGLMQLLVSMACGCLGGLYYAVRYAASRKPSLRGQ